MQIKVKIILKISDKIKINKQLNGLKMILGTCELLIKKCKIIAIEYLLDRIFREFLLRF